MPSHYHHSRHPQPDGQEAARDLFQLLHRTSPKFLNLEIFWDFWKPSQVFNHWIIPSPRKNVSNPKKNRKPCWFDLVGGCYTVKLSPWQWMPRIMENLSGPTRRTIGRQDFEQGLGQPRPNNKPTIRGWFIPYTWWFWGWFRVLDLPHSGVYGMGEKLGTNPPNCFFNDCLNELIILVHTRILFAHFYHQVTRWNCGGYILKW